MTRQRKTSTMIFCGQQGMKALRQAQLQRNLLIGKRFYAKEQVSCKQIRIKQQQKNTLTHTHTRTHSAIAMHKLHWFTRWHHLKINSSSPINFTFVSNLIKTAPAWRRDYAQAHVHTKMRNNLAQSCCLFRLLLALFFPILGCIMTYWGK